MESAKPLTIFLIVVICLAFMGFVFGTSTETYDLDTPLTHWENVETPGVRLAPSYAEERNDEATDGTDVAKACTDCHEERKAGGRPGTHTEHPVGVRLPRSADASALSALGGRTDADLDGNRIVLCRSCHRPHNVGVKARLVEEADTGSLCITCHADHRASASQHPVSGSIDPAIRAVVERLGGASGSLTCLTCHSAHEAASGTLLRTTAAGSAACRTCHVAQATALKGEGHGNQDCADCHGMHARPSHTLSTAKAVDAADQYCVNCHSAGGKGEAIPTSKGHPMWKAMTASMRSSGHTGTVGCTDCHTPHGDSGTGTHLLSAGSVQATCVGCHTEKGTVTGTKHDGTVSAVNGVGETCLTCHSVHGKNKPPAATEGVNPASAVCLACHDGRTTARKPGEFSHPTGVLLTTSGLPARYSGPVPYFGPDGKPTTNRQVGEITCGTCHDVHRWKHDADVKAGDVEGSEQNSFLRDPAQIMEFCAVCHGGDARPRFRFFHKASFRAELRSDDAAQ